MLFEQVVNERKALTVAAFSIKLWCACIFLKVEVKAVELKKIISHNRRQTLSVIVA